MLSSYGIVNVDDKRKHSDQGCKNQSLQNDSIVLS
jgi:hypothetical protein